MIGRFHHLIATFGLGLAISTTVLPVASGPGAKVAARHVRFARLLATSQVRFSSPEFDRIASRIDDSACILNGATRPLPADQERLAKAYASEYCHPWVALWEATLDVCDGDTRPASCDDEATVLEHLDLDGYFTALVAAIRSSATPLERENIMDMVLMPLSAHVIGEYGVKNPVVSLSNTVGQPPLSTEVILSRQSAQAQTD
jgi:hypothetical protein